MNKSREQKTFEEQLLIELAEINSRNRNEWPNGWWIGPLSIVSVVTIAFALYGLLHFTGAVR